MDALADDRGAARQTLEMLQAAGLSMQQALAQVNRLIDQQAFTLAVDDAFFASALLFVALIPLVWMARPRRAAAGGPPVVAD